MKIVKKFIPYFFVILLLIVIKNNVSFILSFITNGSAISHMEKNLASEEERNKYLKTRLSFVGSDQFVVDEAQNKLGMLPSGEYFVIAPTSTPEGNRSYVNDDKPNWQKWLQLFF